jgi:methylated-DNA-[protein]-cysteine S-methyltransferase
MPQLSFHTPLGALTLSEEDGAIVALDWGFGRDQSATPLLIEGRTQLQAYFDGTIETFTLPLSPAGTPYQHRVWAALADIPYGQTCSYAAIAARVGGSARAVGSANGANPIPIVIPCHRVVGSAGLGGYSGGDGLETKRWLLALEQGQPHCTAGLED